MDIKDSINSRKINLALWRQFANVFHYTVAVIISTILFYQAIVYIVHTIISITVHVLNFVCKNFVFLIGKKIRGVLIFVAMAVW